VVRVLDRQTTTPRVRTSVYAVEKDIRNSWNQDPIPFAWTKTADDILELLASHLHRNPGAGH
jgi:hypothetical protein